MIKVLTPLFVGLSKQHSRCSASDIDKAIERVIDCTDPRLRMVSGYRRKLRKPVIHSLLYLTKLMYRIPGSFKINRKAYGADPQVNALFASVEQMEDIFKRSNILRDFFSNSPGCDIAYAGLMMTKSEKNMWGMALQGDTVVKDVAQTAVNFSGHQIKVCAGTISECREKIKWRGVQNLAVVGLERIANLRAKPAELEEERSVLKYKLREMNAQQRGLEPISSLDSDSEPGMLQLEQRLQDIQHTLQKLRAKPETLNDYLYQMCKVLAHPSLFLRVKPGVVWVNRMGIKVDQGTEQKGGKVVTAHVTIGSRPSFEAVLVACPRTDITSSGDRH